MPRRKADVVDRLVKNVAVRIIKIDDIQVDESYQRGVKPSHRKIVADYDPNAIGTILIGERKDGTLWVVDGLQRKTALDKLGYTTVRANVFRSDGPEHEAKIFKKVNLDRQKLSAIDIFRSLLTGHDPIAWEVKKTVEKAGFNVVTNTHNKGTDAKNFQSLMLAYENVRIHGPEPLSFACRMIIQAWPGDPKGTKQALVMAMCSFYTLRKGMVDEDSLLPRLKTVNPHKIQYTGSQYVGGLVQGMIQVLEKLSRKRLPKTN